MIAWMESDSATSNWNEVKYITYTYAIGVAQYEDETVDFPELFQPTWKPFRPFTNAIREPQTIFQPRLRYYAGHCSQARGRHWDRKSRYGEK